MILTVEQLVTTLEQDFTVSIMKPIYSPKISPWLYVHGLQTASFYLDIYRGATLLMRKSFTDADIKGQLQTTDDYSHLFLRLDFDGLILKSGSYKLILGSDDYTFSTSKYIGWVKDWDGDFENLDIPEWKNVPLCFRMFNKENREI